MLTTNTKGLIESSTAQPTTVRSAGDITIKSDGILELTSVAGAVGAAGTTAAGIGNVTLVHNDYVEAALGNNAVVSGGSAVPENAPRSLNILANSSEAIIGISAVGAFGGDNALAGSATVLVMNETTLARIGTSANIDLDDGSGPDAGNINVIATAPTTIVSVAGTLSVSGDLAIGVGVDANSLIKNTKANIDSDVIATVEGDINVKATSTEDVTSVTAGISVSGSTAVTIDAGVHVFNITTLAFIGDEPNVGTGSLGPGHVRALGNIVIDADGRTEMDKVVGVLSASGTTGGAGAVGVSSVIKRTEAFIGEGAKVTAEGTGSTTSVKTGLFTTSAAPSSTETTGINSKAVGANSSIASLQANGEVGSPRAGNNDVNKDGSNDATDPSMTSQRVVTPALRNDFRGLSVTSTNRDDLEIYTFALGFGGTVGVAISAGVGIFENTTQAYVGRGAKVNESMAAAGSGQNVQVIANNDFQNVIYDGSIAVGGSAAISPAIGVSLITHTTKAFIDSTQSNPTSVNARDDIHVSARASEDLLLVGTGFAGGGSFAFGGTVNVMDVDNITTASIGSFATILAHGDVRVTSHDESDTDLVSGALAIGGGGGIGAGVGVMMISKLTEAFVADDANVDAYGNGAAVAGIYNGGDNLATASVNGVIVQAYSQEDYLHLAIVGAGGFVGVSGALGITLIDSDTNAKIGARANINQWQDNANANTNQSVYVNAANKVIGTSFAGAAAGGFVGVAGAVDFGTLKNDTAATIEGFAKVRARNDIEVNALGDKNLDSYAFSGAGGAVALAASVSVWSIGRQLDRNYTNREGQSGDASRGNAAQDARPADEDAATQSNRATNFASGSLGNYGTGGSSNANTSNNRVRGLGNTASSRISSKAPTSASILASLNALASTEPGTTAKVKANAELIAGDRIDVMSNEHAEANGALGTIAGGLAALGAAVGINNMATNSTASIGGSLSAGGDIRVHARHNSETDIVSVAGTAGFVGIGAAVAFINDRTEVAAYTEANTTITAAKNVEIHAIDDRDHYGWTGAIAGGVVAGGASFVRIEVDNPVANRIETRAQVGAGSMIGMGDGAVENLSIKSTPNIKANSEAFGIALGVAAVSANFSEHNLFATSSAQIGAGALINVENLVQIESKQTFVGTSEGIGIAGGVAPVGVMRSDVELGLPTGSAEIQAGVADNVTITAAALTIAARAEGDVNSESVAGSGGGFASAGGIAGVQDYRGTLASIGANSTVNVFSLTVDSVQDTDADAQASAVAFGAVAGVGVEIKNEFNTSANTRIDNGVTIDAAYILIGARNNIEKDKFGVGSGLNLDAVSVSVAGGAGMISNTLLGTVANPYIARVDVAPGATIRALGTYDEPGVLAIEARTDFEAADRANSGEYSLAGGFTVGDSRIIANTLAQVNVTGATIENRFGELVIAARGDGTNATIGDINAASGFSSILTGTSRAETNANQNVTIHNANLKAKDIRLGAGEDRNKASNALNVVSSATGFVASLFPGLVVDSFSVLNERNSIDITGTSKLLAFGDIDLVTREGIGGADRVQPIGDVVAIGLTAFAADADVFKTYDSDNDVNIGTNARLTAGVSSRNVMQILPVTQTLGGQSITIGNALSPAQKAALFAPAPVPNGVDYHFAPLDIASIRIDFYAGYVVQAIAGANAGGTAGHYYQFLPTASDTAVPIRPHLENYGNTARWKAWAPSRRAKPMRSASQSTEAMWPLNTQLH